MSIDTDIRAYLLTLSAVTDIVGTVIRPDRLDESDNRFGPAIIYEIDEDEQSNSLDGKGGLVYADLNVRCRQSTKALARTLHEAVRINGGGAGGLAGYGNNSTAFQAVHESTTAGYLADDDGSDRRAYEVASLYRISFSATT